MKLANPAPPPGLAQPQHRGPNEIELDCRTQQCPVPVLRLAKAAAQLSDGGFVFIRADDPAFPKDLRAWARSAGARIMRFDDHGDGYEAVIRIGDDESGELFAIETAPTTPVAEPPRGTKMHSGRPPAPLHALPRATQTFDLRGHPRDALLETLTRACARAEPGAVIAIVVDDQSFIERLRHWETTTHATLLAIERRGLIIEARIRVESPSPKFEPYALARPAPMVQPDGERCTLLVLHNDHEALLAALLIANGAAAQGMETSVFFTFWGLNLLRGQHPNLSQPEEKIGIMQRLMKWMMPKGPKRQALGKMHFAGLGKGMLSAIMRQQQIMTLPELIDNAQQLGVRFTACTMSMSVMGIARRDLHPYPNLDYGGVASFVEDARNSAINLVF